MLIGDSTIFKGLKGFTMMAKPSLEISLQIFFNNKRYTPALKEINASGIHVTYRYARGW